MEGVRRLTKTIQVYRAEQAVPIDFRLPGDAKRCIGLQAVVVGHIPTVRPVIPVFGEYSLEFEGKKVHPVNFIVPYVSQLGFDEETHHRPGLLPLSVAVEDNRLVTGFYRDLGTQDMADDRGFTPYSVRFTFSLHVDR